MKKLVKMMALVLTFVMCVGMLSFGAFASSTETTETTAYDKPLTVTGLTKGDTVKFYQVIKWVGEEDGNVAGWKAVDAYKDVLTEAKLKEVLVGTKADATTTPPTGITSELAGQLAKLATNGVDGTINEAGDTATLENAEAGMWMAIVTPAKADTIYNPVFVSSDYVSGNNTVSVTDSYNGDAVAKKSDIPLDKTAKDRKSVDDDDQHTVAVGDVLDFTVTTSIPGYGKVYTDPKFDVTDTLNGLELVEDTIEVKAGDTVLTKEEDYTISPENYGGGTTYTVSFTKTYLEKLTAATPITIKYAAEVTVDAKDAINQTDNEVTIKYSHDPNNQTDYNIKKDTTQHYTFTLDASGIGGGDKTSQKGTKTSELVKIGVDAAGNPITQKNETSTIEDGTKESWEGPLDGAVFGLFTDEAGTEPLKDKDNNDVTATTGTDGRMTFAGLDAGTYYIKEISAPAGYVTNSDVYKVEIKAETEEVEVTETVEDKEVTYKTDVLKSYTVTITDKEGKQTEAAKYTFTNEKEATDNDIQWTVMDCVEHPFPFTNTKGTELPSTGGMGTTMLYLVGAILIIGAGVLLVTRRRMSAK